MTAKVFLVTGASGFLGYHLCKYLLDKGNTVRGLDIADFGYPDLKDRVEFIKGDIRDKDMMAKACQGMDIVIHGAAALPLWPKEEIYSINIEGTRVTLQAAFDVGIKRVVFISTTSVYGIPTEHPVTEKHPLVSLGSYGDTKIKAEQICDEFRQRGMCVPVLRPKTFAGPMRLGVFQILCEWVKEGRKIPIIGSGNNRYQLLHIDDLDEAIYLASLAPEDKANDVFNIGSKAYTTMKGDLQALLDFAGFGKHVAPIPAWLVIPVLKVLEKIHLSPLYEWIYETAGKEYYCSMDKIENQLGWVSRKSTADVWIDTYRWYRDEYSKTARAETGVSHRVPWKQGILKLVKIFF